MSKGFRNQSIFQSILIEAHCIQILYCSCNQLILLKRETSDRVLCVQSQNLMTTIGFFILLLGFFNHLMCSVSCSALQLNYEQWEMTVEPPRKSVGAVLCFITLSLFENWIDDRSFKKQDNKTANFTTNPSAFCQALLEVYSCFLSPGLTYTKITGLCTAWCASCFLKISSHWKEFNKRFSRSVDNLHYNHRKKQRPFGYVLVIIYTFSSVS